MLTNLTHPSGQVRRSTFVVLAALIGALALTLTLAIAPRASAQEDTAYWAFAPNMPFADTRVAEAFAAYMDFDAAGDAAGVTLEHGIEGVTFAAGPDDAPMLLAAAGLMPPEGGDLGLVEVRTCAVWASEDDLLPAAESLGADLVAALDDLGLSVAACEVADDPDAADIVVWSEANDPEIDFFQEGEGGFLALDTDEAPAPDNGDENGNGNGDEDGKDDGDVPDPAVGGFGVFNDAAGAVVPAWLLAAMILLAALSAARLATGRFSR